MYYNEKISCNTVLLNPLYSDLGRTNLLTEPLTATNIFI